MAQVKKSYGVFNSLDGRLLRHNINETETTDFTLSKLNWNVTSDEYLA
jgi:hypothetical protein